MTPDPETPRVPPGQGPTSGWPVLHLGEVPAFDPATWSLVVHGCVERPREFTWDAWCALEHMEQSSDFHCVTGWSRLDVAWGGVGLAALLSLVAPRAEARFVRFADAGVYDTSVPLGAARGGLLADRADGAPLAPEHGGPLRAVVPSLYGWKSCKWVREVEVLAQDRLGFWEVRGYHNGADPWREERYV